MSAGPAGAAAITWGERPGYPDPTRVLQSSRAPGSASFAPAQELFAGAASDNYGVDYARIAYAPDGRAVAVWSQAIQNYNNDWNNVFSAAREPGSTSFDLSTSEDISTGASPSTSNAQYPEVAAGGDGSFDVVWIRISQNVIQARWTAPSPKRLNVSKTGSGTGTVSSSPSGIDCGATCSALFDAGAQVTLTASPASGSNFVKWAGDCSGTAATCTVTLDRLREVVAEFASDSPTPPTPSN